MSSRKLPIRINPAYVAWFIAALFYYFQYILRVSPGVMVTDLRQEFRMTAEQFSFLGSLYLYAYSLLQIPLGLLIDRLGVRRVVLVSLLLCMVGACLLASAQSLLVVEVSRLLTGAGSAAAFMAALKLAADYLPAGKRGLLMGATLTLGTIGAYTAGKPLVWLIDSVGWRQTVSYTAGLGLLMLAISFLFLRLPAKPQAPGPQEQRKGELFTDLLQIVRNRRIMLYAVLAIGLYTPLSVLADLWGTAFLMQKFTLARADAAQAAMMMYLGLALGSLVLPWISERWNILDLSIKICSLGILGMFALVLLGPDLGWGSLVAVLFILGVFCGGEMMCFAGAARYATPENSGLTLGVVNTLNMMGGALLQQAIGFLLDAQWSGGLDAAGVRVYETHEFIYALSLLLLVAALCTIVSFMQPKASQS